MYLFYLLHTIHTTNIWLILVEFAIWQPKILFEMGVILQVYSVAVYAHCTNKYNFRFPKNGKQEEEEHHFCQKYLVQYYIISKM